MVTVSNVGMLIVARAVAGSLHGLFIGVAFVLATSIVPPERIGRAIATVTRGIAVSTALGVPIGTLVGQARGRRGAFSTIVVFGVIALVGTLVFVSPVENTGTGRLSAEIRYTLAPHVLAVLGTRLLLILGGQFATLTCITQLLAEITGISSGLIGMFLLVNGAVGFGLIPSQQYRVVTLAGPGRDLAATLPASALNAGIAATYELNPALDAGDTYP